MSSIFERASKPRKKHPKKYKDWQDYVKWAGRIDKPKAATKKSRRSAPKKVSGAVSAAPKAVGSVAYHKSQARKQVEQQLAWLLLARDQEKKKRERLKLSKKVALKRQELQKLK